MLSYNFWLIERRLLTNIWFWHKSMRPSDSACWGSTRKSRFRKFRISSVDYISKKKLNWSTLYSVHTMRFGIYTSSYEFCGWDQSILSSQHLLRVWKNVRLDVELFLIGGAEYQVCKTRKLYCRFICNFDRMFLSMSKVHSF